MSENDFHREHLGELTTLEVEALVSHLRWIEKFTDLLGELMDVEPAADAGELADRLEWLLKRAQRRTALDALEKGQCEVVVHDKRCEGVKGHDGDCPQPFQGDSTKMSDGPFTEEVMKFVREQVAYHNLVVHKGKLHISVAHCVHCNHVTLGQMSDECTNCGGELYPVRKIFPMGVALDRATLDQTS